MTKATPLFLLAALVLTAFPSLASAQGDRSDAPQFQEPLRVFLDCERYICDSDHFRREVDFISYVRDRTSSS